MPDFIPRRDSDCARFALSFAQTLAADAVAYGVTAEQAAACVAAAEAFAEANIAAAGGGRGVATLRAKHERRAELEHVMRPLAAMLRSNRRVTDTMLVTLGLRARRSSYSKAARPLPSEPPSVSVVNCDGSTFRLHVIPGAGVGRGGLPDGAAGVTIESCVSETPPYDGPGGWRPAAWSSRSRMTLTFGAAIEPGQRVWLRACYRDTRHRAGPWSQPIQRRVADRSMFAVQPKPVPGFAMRRVA